MPRVRRAAGPDTVHHILNRGNRRQVLFQDSDDYHRFLTLMRRAADRYPVALLAYCLMPNHWHMVVRPAKEGALSAYVGWLATSHVRQHHSRNGTSGMGHLYQGRFKSFLVQTDVHLLAVLRYVEANALRAGLVPRAEQWPWCSLARESQAGPPLASSPVQRPADWLTYVNLGAPAEELQNIRRARALGSPFGGMTWTRDVVSRCGLESLLRARGRPRLREGARSSDADASYEK